MSEDSDPPQLIIALQVARQRAKAMGFYKADKFHRSVTVELLKTIRIVIDLPETSITTSRFLTKSIAIITAKYIDEQFPYEINELRKIITSLNLLHLPTDEENKQLTQLESELESIIPPLKNMEKQFTDDLYSPSFKPQIYLDVRNAQDKLVNIIDRFDELHGKVDRRITDNVSIICQMLDPVRGEKLFRLLMNEP